MEEGFRVEGKVCNIFIENGFENFNKDLYEIKLKTKNIYKSGMSTVQKFDISSIYDSILVITDQNVCDTQLNRFIENLDKSNLYKYVIEAGEESKSIDVYEEIMKYCIQINLSRRSAIIALGGGVVGDLSGFIASTYMRGIDVIQVPTTLLSQVDSSIGGKTGINLGKLKNIIGTFYQPKLTYINVNALKTLPDREFISGMAEVIKYGLIYDYEILDYLIINSQQILDRDTDKLNYIVRQCATIKSEIVSKDEKESGLRKILNLGHTFGHGVEKLCGISHGEAVCIGINMAFNLSLKKGFVDNDYYSKFIDVCQKYGLPLRFSGPNEKEVFNIMKNDKKNGFGKLNLILPTGLGKVEEFIQDYDSIEKDIIEIITMCKNK